MLNNVSAWYSFLLISFLYVLNVIGAVGNPDTDERLKSVFRIILFAPMAYFVAVHLPV